jgi:hypothetical protein
MDLIRDEVENMHMKMCDKVLSVSHEMLAAVILHLRVQKLRSTVYVESDTWVVDVTPFEFCLSLLHT